MRGPCTTKSTTSGKRPQTWSRRRSTLCVWLTAHDATKAKLEFERRLEALSAGYETLREEMVLQECELSTLRAALDDAHTLREAEAKRAFSESLRANAEGQRAEEAAALAASRQANVPPTREPCT